MKRKIGEDHEAYNDVIKGTKNWKKASIASGLAHGIPSLCGDPDTYALTRPVWPVPLTPFTLHRRLSSSLHHQHRRRQRQDRKMVKKSKKSKSKRVTLKAKHKVLRKVKEHHRKKRKEARKDGKNHKSRVEKDPGIPNEWPFKEQELKALEVRRAQALKELELKKEARKERVSVGPLFRPVQVPLCAILYSYCLI
jgi:hypothetical protein